MMHALRSVVAVFDKQAAVEKEKILKRLSPLQLSPSKLQELHGLLLFLSAYPQNKTLLHLTEKQLNAVSERSAAIVHGNNRQQQYQLTNSGIAHTRLNVSFSFELIKSLTKEFGSQVSFFSMDADAATAEQVLCACLPTLSRDIIADRMLTAVQMIDRLKPVNADALAFLIHLFESVDVAPEVRDALWDPLNIFITWNLTADSQSFTKARSLNRKVFIHGKPLLKKFNSLRLIYEKLPAARTLNEYDRHQLIRAARGQLAMLLRETDPVTYADENAVTLFSLDRGVDIALYSMTSDRRLPLESYIGYMAFKNRVPVAYGGGWIFLFRSKIGINIFPALRGGESAFLFCQILRVYHRHFNVKKFIVEPYQIGKNNMEGLRSGAFWFYYRLGFRPASEKLKLLAEAEFERISADKNYRAPLSVMRQLSKQNLELNLSPGEKYPDIDPLTISDAVNKWESFCQHPVEAKNNHSEILSKVFALPHHDQEKFYKLFSEKISGTERDFILRAQKETRIFGSLINRVTTKYRT